MWKRMHRVDRKGVGLELGDDRRDDLDSDADINSSSIVGGKCL